MNKIQSEVLKDSMRTMYQHIKENDDGYLNSMAFFPFCEDFLRKADRVLSDCLEQIEVSISTANLAKLTVVELDSEYVYACVKDILKKAYDRLDLTADDVVFDPRFLIKQVKMQSYEALIKAKRVRILLVVQKNMVPNYQEPVLHSSAESLANRLFFIQREALFNLEEIGVQNSSGRIDFVRGYEIRKETAERMIAEVQQIKQEVQSRSQASIFFPLDKKKKQRVHCLL